MVWSLSWEKPESIKAAPSRWSAIHRAAVRCACLEPILLAAVSCLIGGCTGPVYRNVRLKAYDLAVGYRFDALRPGERNSDETFVCVTFSGGGTRAAALSYGVLQELRDTAIPDAAMRDAAKRDAAMSDTAVSGTAMRGTAVFDAAAHDETDPADGHGPRAGGQRLLDEVDVISSVSGGSFTALGYGLWRDGLFDGRFEQRFLKRDMESALIGHLLAPQNFFLLPFILLDTIDVAADFYDRRIFDDRRYADLVRQGERPYVVVNATNLALGRRFEFTQGDFDVLASDLGQMPLGYSAAASSAFPIVFSPMRLRYFPAPEGEPILQDILTAPQAELHDERRCLWAKSLVPEVKNGAPPSYDLDEWHRRFCYLVDGGLADNLGLMHFIHEYQHGYIARRIADGRIRRLLLIVVDAGNRPRETIEQEASSPGLFTVGYKTAITGIDNHNETLVQMVRLLLDGHAASAEAYEHCREALAHVCPDATPPDSIQPAKVDAYVVHVSLRDLTDDRERECCLSMPTRFRLPADEIDLLMRGGRCLLEQNPEFQRFLREFGAEDAGADALDEAMETPARTRIPAVEDVSAEAAAAPHDSRGETR
ncbi:MAG: patatin-like phospholipase family protein [Phycisphaerales bacterium]|nr:patatin-like phospholipase family protein [Phycisphaerales bacterium]